MDLIAEFIQVYKKRGVLVWLLTFIFGLSILFLFGASLNQLASFSNKVKEGKYIGVNPAQRETMTFTGEASEYSIPNMAEVNISVITENTNLKEALETHSKKMNAVTQFIQSKGIPESKISTANYNISPKYRWIPSTGRNIIDGYMVNQTVHVKIEDLAKVPVILDGAVDQGANEINGLTFTVKNKEIAQQEARKLAIAQAKTKAQEISSALGISLGAIVGYNENAPGNYPVPMYYRMDAKMGGAEASVAPSTPAGEVESKMTVSLTFEIVK